MTPVEWSFIAGSIGYAVVEYWLGRTDKVKAGSAIEAALNGAKFIFTALSKKKTK